MAAPAVCTLQACTRVPAPRAAAQQPPRVALQASRPLAAAAAARRRQWRAAAEKEGGSSSTQQGEKPQAADASAGAGQQQEQQPAAAAGAAETLGQAQTMSVEEIQKAAAELRQMRAEGAKQGLLEGVNEEVGLIKWPAPGKAVLQTLLVIAIVGGTAAALLAINGLLAELGQLY